LFVAAARFVRGVKNAFSSPLPVSRLAVTLDKSRGGSDALQGKMSFSFLPVSRLAVTLPTNCMHMDFTTPVELPEHGPEISPRSRCLWLGSCFAEHMGLRMKAAGMPVEVNPFGVLYNPESIRQALTILADGRLPEGALFEGRDGMWHSWCHSGAFSAPGREACREAVAESLARSRSLHERMDFLFVTWGTTHVYVHRQSGEVVANCHRQPAADFEERALTADEIHEAWSKLLGGLHAAHPELTVVFTVSPYRYAKYGMHGNQLSKAALLLAVDRLCREHAYCHYFPAYEIVVDELRDYRFYDRDMLHPSPQAVDYVWERFRRWAFGAEAERYWCEWQSLQRDLGHRPLHPESDEARRFRERTLRRRDEFERKWGLTAPPGAS